VEITLMLAVILAVGFIAAKAGQAIRLPSVTGFIAAGVLLGPSGLHIITAEATGNQLAHFTQIALMLIALGIGEHLEFKKIKRTAKTVLSLCLADCVGAFLLVAGIIFVFAWLFFPGENSWHVYDYLVLAILLGAISVATAPGSILLIARETRSSGQLTNTLLQVVAVNNGLAIILFGIALVFARHVVGAGGAIYGTILISLVQIFGSIFLGVLTGLLIDFVIHRLKDHGEMLTGGLALLLLSGEVARFLSLSPLLVGIAVGFTIVNRDRRDVRIFRTLNAFEPPIYVLFFTLAGAHLDLTAIKVAGWLGLVYFILRLTNKVIAGNIGGLIAAAPDVLRKYIGIALVPQAGIAIGLVFLINGDANLGIYASILTPAVLVGVLLAELIGPACTKYALEKAGEAADWKKMERANGQGENQEFLLSEEVYGAQLVPWSWEKLTPSLHPAGTVLFGVSHLNTVGGLARAATLMAHHFEALPLAVRVDIENGDNAIGNDAMSLFDEAQKETRSLGYPLKTTEFEAETVAGGIVAAAAKNKSKSILLGYPFQRTEQKFAKIVEAVAAASPCPVIIVRFTGILHTERILVPIINMKELSLVGDTLCSLAHVGKHRITLLKLLAADEKRDQHQNTEKSLYNWGARKNLQYVQCIATSTEARLKTILDHAATHDLVIMAVSEGFGLKKMLFGSLADDVASQCQRPMLMIHRAKM
jgi:Kef-type K+ transport system membrane component KefB/nucleotide-binding universal stress UspA family protein